MDDPVRSFPYGAEFPLGRVFGCWGDFVQDKVVDFVQDKVMDDPIVDMF